jgi:DNA mismatch endonuclease (patch repair protein)
VPRGTRTVERDPAFSDIDRPAMVASRRRRGVPPPSSDDVRRRMQATGQRDTAAELAIRSILHGMGMRYRVDRAPVPGLRRRADLVFATAKVAVFIDGCFWHGCPEHATWPKAHGDWWRAKILENGQRDRDTDERLSSHGWIVLRVWEHEDPKEAANRISRSVGLQLKRGGAKLGSVASAAKGSTREAPEGRCASSSRNDHDPVRTITNASAMNAIAIHKEPVFPDREVGAPRRPEGLAFLQFPFTRCAPFSNT